MALDGATSFIRFKEFTNKSKRMRHSQTIGGNSSVQWRKVDEAEYFKYVFGVYCVL